MKKYLLLPALMLSLHLGAVESTGEFVWNELATSNVKASKDFYGKMFGWEFSDKKTDGPTYTIITKGAQEIGGIWEIPAAQQSQIPPHWLSYLSVDNLVDALEKARQNGATIVKPIQKAGDMGQFAVIKDPSGAYIALWQPLKKN